jgi:hypothetical protein
LLRCVCCCWLYPPARASFYPACPIREFLGIDCPGCGATRALAALLRGHVLEALRLNPLFVLLLPVALAGAIEAIAEPSAPEPFRWPQPPAPAALRHPRRHVDLHRRPQPVQ